CEAIRYCPSKTMTTTWVLFHQVADMPTAIRPLGVFSSPTNRQCSCPEAFGSRLSSIVVTTLRAASCFMLLIIASNCAAEVAGGTSLMPATICGFRLAKKATSPGLSDFRQRWEGRVNSTPGGSTRCDQADAPDSPPAGFVTNGIAIMPAPKNV